MEVQERQDAAAHEEDHEAQGEVDALQGRQARHEQDEDEPAEEQRRRLDARGIGRARERHVVEEVLDDLRVDLDPRHEFSERRGLVVEQAAGGQADEHDLVFQDLGIDLALEHGGGRARSARDRACRSAAT
jgi:hypothetical protein